MMSNTLDRFAEELKAYLKLKGSWEFVSLEGYSTSGYYCEVDWDALNIEIDEFCAEFKAKHTT